MVGPALCAAAPEAMVSISNEMAAALRIKERSLGHAASPAMPRKAMLVTHDAGLRKFMRLAGVPLVLRHYIIRRLMPVGFRRQWTTPNGRAPQLFSISFPSSAASFSVSASFSLSPRCLFTARA